MTAQYIAMINMPGYMPDSDPVTFDTHAEAENYLLEQINESFDNVSEGRPDIPLEKLEEELTEARQALLKYGHCYFQNYYYGVNNA